MKILVIGGGGREHALVWKLAKSARVKQIYAAPGNAGIAQIATCVNISAEDIDQLIQFALENRIDLTVVGPEAPLTLGIVDRFHQKGLQIFGPSAKASQIEGSKVFAKNLMVYAGIPTPEFEIFETIDPAISYIKEKGAPIVIKADGLAAGKGAIVAKNVNEALRAAQDMLVKGLFGVAGKRIVVEEYLQGEEASVLAFSDGKSVLTMISTQDHKQIYDGDKGPNTGGMGAYAPAPVVDKNMLTDIEERILKLTVREMDGQGCPYVGVLYAGLIITEEGPKVLEFNCRFGDPETQPLFALMETDLFDIMEKTLTQDLKATRIEWTNQHAVCVVLASGGYPSRYQKGKTIGGLNEASALKNVVVFHAGTALSDRKYVTSGGRVLGVTGLGDSLEGAVERAYEGVDRISFEAMYYRRDIGAKGLAR
ncbi:phosphoribosylamine--glycine ligase [candidate division TA06 bacterium]|uniref:Phosphoribosylamine--glycine ligase n=1 Tax=candidate division TA06 bacterium TaxID=2250710 RepID=A0A523XWA1_UNCT6|nr:MAG: phosphoribosylamine--glycine ligase [candidate division TA06 bacterium]